MIIKRILVSLSFLALLSCHHKSEKIFIPSKKKISHQHNYYRNAEQITYAVNYGIFHGGDVKMVVPNSTLSVNNIPCYRVKVSAELSGAVDAIFSVNDSWESCIDTNSLLPCKISQLKQENKYRKADYTLFDRVQEKAFITDTTNPAAPEYKNYPITPDIEDMLSSFFLLRNVQFEKMKVNDTTTIDVFMDDRCYNLRIKLLGEEKIKVNSKKQKAYVISTYVAGVESDEQVKGWISADERRIPLRVKFRLPVISAELELKEYKSN